jgi:glycosyltransferase involved in cell wall biosynthesis
MSSKVIVALPAYNEEKYISGIVGKAAGYADTVIVLDDGSTDGTAWRATDAGAKLIQHKVNKGYGSAIQSILSAVRGTDFSTLVVIDSDSQHDPADIPKLVKVIEDGYDLAIGCRASKDVPFYRRIGGTTLSVLTWFLSNMWVRDSQCGFRAYSKRAVELIRPKESGMAVSSEIVALAAWSRLWVKEVPISVRYLEDSSTHNPWKQGFYTLWRILVMLVKDTPREGE